MVDRTNYPAHRTPELAVRQIFGRQKLPENLCLLMADSGMLEIERIAMPNAKTTIRAIVGDDTQFEREVSLKLVAGSFDAARSFLISQG